LNKDDDSAPFFDLRTRSEAIKGLEQQIQAGTLNRRDAVKLATSSKSNFKGKYQRMTLPEHEQKIIDLLGESPVNAIPFLWDNLMNVVTKELDRLEVDFTLKNLPTTMLGRFSHFKQTIVTMKRTSLFAYSRFWWRAWRNNRKEEGVRPPVEL